MVVKLRLKRSHLFPFLNNAKYLANASIKEVPCCQIIGYLSQYLEHQTILLATLGGLSIGLIALVYPQTLFFGEKEIETIVDTGAGFGAAMLLAIALAKMLAVSCTLHSGFRGGFIFPLFYIGAAVGLAISLAVPQIHPTIGMVCMMAAVNVAVTKTPISTTIILSVLSDTAMVSTIAIASFMSFFLTSKVCLIQTQRSRTLAIAAENLGNLTPALLSSCEPFIVRRVGRRITAPVLFFSPDRSYY